MAIILHVEPQAPPMTREMFIKETPKGSIALDGYVSAEPFFDPKTKHINFNHHEGVDRLATRATCAQCLLAVREGMLDAFKNKDGALNVHIYVDDCDEDVCLSVFILKNHEIALRTSNSRFNRLVMMEDLLDTTSGAYDFPPSLRSLKELMWIFEPYHRFRLSVGYGSKNPFDYERVIAEVEKRIFQFLLGSGSIVELDTRYEVIGGGKGWTMVKETGLNARVGIYSDGIRAFVSVRKMADGRYSYVVGRRSLFVPFNVSAILEVANAFEKELYEKEKEGDDIIDEIASVGVTRARRRPLGELIGLNEKWGGSELVGGGPRVHGSRITPEQFSKIVEKNKKV